MTAAPLDETSALIVVDVQAGTLANAKTVTSDVLIERITLVADWFREAARPVFFVVTTGTPPGGTAYGPGGRIWPEGFDALAPGLARRPDEPLLSRRGWSAFAETGIDEALRSRAVTDVVITGIATSFGVESTARAAYDLGYSVSVVVDAVADPSETAHARFVDGILPALGRAVRTDDLLAH